MIAATPTPDDLARRGRLTPSVAAARYAVRLALAAWDADVRPSGNTETSVNPEANLNAGIDAKPEAGAGVDADPNADVSRAAPLALVALSGGPDSLALAAAAAFVAPRIGWRAGAIIVDHDLQPGSAEVAARAAHQARGLGMSPVVIRRVAVAGSGGPEAVARDARHAAVEDVRRETGASVVLLGHTLDDQAEQVLLGLARGSGAGSLRGMRAVRGTLLRPLLGVRRATTQQMCRDLGLTPWDDPHNIDPTYARVRVRHRVLPALEAELGPGIAEALARTASQLDEDAQALDAWAREVLAAAHRPASPVSPVPDRPASVEPTSPVLPGPFPPAPAADAAAPGPCHAVALDIAVLAGCPDAVRSRVIRMLASDAFGITVIRSQTLAVNALITGWHGQGPIVLPTGVRVSRTAGTLVFSHGPGAATAG